MSKATRLQDHKDSLDLIEKLVYMDSYTKEVNHEHTAESKVSQRIHENRSFEATEKACEAFERLLQMAETRDSGQIRSIATVIAAVWGTIKLDPCELRGLDQEIGDDCMAVLDGVRWGRISVSEFADDADARVPAVLRAWGLMDKPEQQTG